MTEQERIEWVGRSLYGAPWRGRLAEGLRMSRVTLWSIMSGSRKSGRDIDGDMIGLIDRERDATVERATALTKLRNRLIAMRKEAGNAAA